MDDKRNALRSDALADVLDSISGYLADDPLKSSGVSEKLNAFFSLKKPSTSARIPPPHAEKVPQRMHVNTDAAILSELT